MLRNTKMGGAQDGTCRIRGDRREKPGRPFTAVVFGGGGGGGGGDWKIHDGKKESFTGGFWGSGKSSSCSLEWTGDKSRCSAHRVELTRWQPDQGRRRPTVQYVF